MLGWAADTFLRWLIRILELLLSTTTHIKPAPVTVQLFLWNAGVGSGGHLLSSKLEIGRAAQLIKPTLPDYPIEAILSCDSSSRRFKSHDFHTAGCKEARVNKNKLHKPTLPVWVDEAWRSPTNRNSLVLWFFKFSFQITCFSHRLHGG